MDFHALQTFITEQKGVSPLKYWLVRREQAEDGYMNIVGKELRVSQIFFSLTAFSPVKNLRLNNRPTESNRIYIVRLKPM